MIQMMMAATAVAKPRTPGISAARGVRGARGSRGARALAVFNVRMAAGLAIVASGWTLLIVQGLQHTLGG